MAANPNWFPPPPVKPLTQLSNAQLFWSAVLPIGLIAVALVLVLTHKTSRATGVSGRSNAAFTACVKAKQVADPPHDATTLQNEVNGCASHLPKGTRVPQVANDANRGGHEDRAAMNACLQAALANVAPRTRLGGGPSRQQFENAISMCRAVSSGAHPAPATPVGQRTA